MSGISQLHRRTLDAAIDAYGAARQGGGMTENVSPIGVCAIAATVLAWLLVILVVCY